MRHDVDGRQALAPRQRRRDLTRHGTGRVQHECLDAGTQTAQDRVEVRNGRVDEKQFGAACHQRGDRLAGAGTVMGAPMPPAPAMPGIGRTRTGADGRHRGSHENDPLERGVGKSLFELRITLDLKATKGAHN